MARSTRSSWLRVFAASTVTYAKNMLAYYGRWGFVLVRLSVPAFMIATAWALSRIASGSSLVVSLGYPDYTAYVAMGYAFTGVLFTTVFHVGEKLHDELVQGTLETVLVTPASRLAWLLGSAFGNLLVSLVDVAMVTAYYTALFETRGLHLGMAHHAVAAIALGILGLVGMGLMMAGIIVNLKEPHGFSVLLTPFLMLLSGMMFPVEILPHPLNAVSQLLPLTHTLTLLRNSILLGTPLTRQMGTVEILIVESAAYMAAGYVVFTALESRARRTGTLVKF